MAQLTSAQLNKWNEGAGQGFKLDLQDYFNWHEKNLEYRGEAREDGTFFGVSFRYHDETIGEGWTAKKTGKQLLYLTVDRYIPGSVEGVYQLDRLFSEIVGDPQNKKMFSYMQKMSHEIDLRGYLARAEEMRPIGTPNKEPEPISLLDMIESVEEAAQEPETMQEPDASAEICEGMIFEDASGSLHTITNLSYMSVEFNNGGHCLFDFGTSRTISAILDALGTGSRLIFDPSNSDGEPETAQETPQEDTQPEGMETIEELDTQHAQATENAAESATDAETVQENTQPEETQQEAENTTETATSEAMPDMFAELARAYFTGKSAKPTKKPAQAKEKPQAVYSPTEAEKPAEEPQEPQKTEPGYFGNDNVAFTEEELSALANGGQVEKNDNIYFTIQHSESARLVFSAYTYGENIEPNNPHKYIGFIVSGNFYRNTSDIENELRKDIDKRLHVLVPDQSSAAHAAANVESWIKRDIDTALEWDYTGDAERLFYDGKSPELFLYASDNKVGNNTLIEYIKNPAAIVERLALEYLSHHPEKIYIRYIRFNGTLAKLNTILDDPGNDAHIIKKIRQSVTDQKTLRLELSSGKEVKVEARLIKRIDYSGISSWQVNACDRQYMPVDENGKQRNIKVRDIVAIYHGGRTLYKAA